MTNRVVFLTKQEIDLLIDLFKMVDVSTLPISPRELFQFQLTKLEMSINTGYVEVVLYDPGSFQTSVPTLSMNHPASAFVLDELLLAAERLRATCGVLEFLDAFIHINFIYEDDAVARCIIV